MKKIMAFGLLGVMLFSFISCGKGDEPKKIDFSKTEDIKVTSTEKPIRIAVSAMITPKETFIYYKDIINYIGQALKRPVELIQRETYAEVNDLIEKKEIDAAFVCSGPYVVGKKKFGMELLVAPLVHGELIYYSYIIVPKNSSLQDFSELKGKKFAFTDSDSNTGCLVPKYELAKIGESPDSFFSKYIFTKSHDNSIKAVAKSLVDGAAVDHLIWEYLNKTNPEFTSQTRIIKKLGPFGIPPIVVHPKYDSNMKAQLKQIFLDMHKDNKGKSILTKIFIDKFVVVDDRLYDSVRQMQGWIDNRK
jgi:phosphonate transport system substrate-binding protein